MLGERKMSAFLEDLQFRLIDALGKNARLFRAGNEIVQTRKHETEDPAGIAQRKLECNESAVRMTDHRSRVKAELRTQAFHVFGRLLVRYGVLGRCARARITTVIVVNKLQGPARLIERSMQSSAPRNVADQNRTDRFQTTQREPYATRATA